MITTKKLFSALVALSMSIVMVSCAGDDGEQGPAGPAGNANVNSNEYLVNSSDWTGTNIKRDTIAVSAITQSVVDNGAVLVYHKSEMSTSSDSTWSALPYSYNITLNSGQQQIAAIITIRAAIEVGEVQLSAINSLNANITGSPTFPGDRSFKVVVIPSASLVEGVDVNDYEQVSAVYGIQEFDM